MAPTANGIALGDIATWGSTAIALVALIRTYVISHRLDKDERLVFGPLLNPNLLVSDHKNSTLVAKVVNVGQRRATIDRIEFHTASGIAREVIWGEQIDTVGNVVNPLELASVESAISLFIRDREMRFFQQGDRITVFHSQRNSPTTLVLQGPF